THVESLAKRGVIDIAVVDPGSCQFSPIDLADRETDRFIYLNPEDHILRGLELSETYGLRPSYAIYEPGFTRLGASLAGRFARLKTPIYRFMFSDAFAWGFAPTRVALEAHLDLLKRSAGLVPWMIAGFSVDLRGLIHTAVDRGGHIRVGLED